jgi:hypothetical protein
MRVVSETPGGPSAPAGAQYRRSPQILQLPELCKPLPAVMHAFCLKCNPDAQKIRLCNKIPTLQKAGVKQLLQCVTIGVRNVTFPYCYFKEPPVVFA